MRTLFLGACTALVLWASCTKTPDIADESEVFRQKLLQANNAFSIKLLQQVHTHSDTANTVLSPFSLSIGLSILANGAESTTKDAIINAQEMQGLTLTDVNQTYKDLLVELKNADPDVELKLANSVWLSTGLSIKSVFQQINQLYYQIALEQIDFASAGATETVNNWVNNLTAGNIQQIVDAFNDGDGIYGVNALWFKARFKQGFDSTLTTQQPFYIGYTETAPVDMMSGRGMKYGYYGDNEVKIADLAYESGSFSFTIIMPSDNSSLSNLIQGLTTARWDTWMNGLSYDQSPNLFLPKFTVSYTGSVKQLLASVGMGEAFTDMANFSNINDGVLSLADIRHNVSLSVSEKGVLAPSGTPNSSNRTFSVNKPFLFAVRDNASGRILILGKIVNPTNP